MRLEITRKSDLAVRAIAALAKLGRLKGAQLAEMLGTTPGFMAQVMAPLTRAGFVGSEPGPTGGYVLLVPAESLSVLDVIEAVEGPTVTGRCVLTGGRCPEESETCALHDAWLPARAALLERLASTPVVVAVRRDGVPVNRLMEVGS